MKQFLSNVGMDDIIAAVGAALIAWGLGLICVPAALIATGAALIALAFWRM